MEYFIKKREWSFLLTAIGLLVFFGCGKVENLENFKNFQEESFVRGGLLDATVSGTVTDPVTGMPLPGVMVKSGSFSTMTDASGNFSVDINTDSATELISVSKEGYIDYDFPVCYAHANTGFAFNWAISLSTRQDYVWIGPEEGAWYKVEVSGVEYIIDIRRGSVDAWMQLAIGPGGAALGTGIPLAYAAIGLSVETSDASGVVFKHPVDIRYDALTAFGSKGGIGSGSINSAAASSLIANGANLQEIGDVLYGPGNYEVSPSNQYILRVPFVGEYVLVNGIQVDQLFFPFLPTGGINEDANPQTGIGGIPVDNDPCTIGNIPHQSVGDGCG